MSPLRRTAEAYLPIPTGTPTVLKVVPEKDVKEMQGRHEIQMHRITVLMGAVVLVLLLGFVTLLFALGSILLDGWRFNSEAYKNYIETVRTQGLAIEQANRDRDELLTTVKALKLEIETQKKTTK